MMLLIFFSQCDQCKAKPVEDMTQWELGWDQVAVLNDFPSSIDVQRGLICHVPSEDAVYLLDPSAQNWKFTQISTGGLSCEPIADLSDIGTHDLFFAFPAGSVHKQTLHLGIFDGQKVVLKQYQENNWESVADYNLSSLGLLPANVHQRSAACCLTRTEDSCNGLIVLKPNNAWSNIEQTLVLHYDADKQTLEKSSTWQYAKRGLPQTAIEIASGVILVKNKATVTPTVFCWTNKKSQCEELPGQTVGSLQRSDLFLLHAGGFMSQAVWACFVYEAGKSELQFYTVNHEKPYLVQRSSDLPEVLEADDQGGTDHSIDHSKSLVIPFSDAVYVVTKDRAGQPIYYKGSLQDPAK